MPTDVHMDVWQGRIDPEDGQASLRFHQVVKPATAISKSNDDKQGICFIGFASDLGVRHNQGRLGAKQGPLALRKAISNLAWHCDSGLYDAGDIQVPASGDDPLAEAQSNYAEQVVGLLAKQQHVIGLGGGHEIGWASYQGCRQFLKQSKHANAKIGILNFDAHFDLRMPPIDAPWAGSSGTPFYQVAVDCEQRNIEFHYACLGINQSSNTKALFETANNLNVSYLLDTQCNPQSSLPLINEFIAKLDYLYITICLDAFPASVAPGVSAPAPLGISLMFTIDSLQKIRNACDKNNVKWLMSDIAELNPAFDLDNRTAKVAALLAYELIKLNQQ